jgi:hypothetical protein
VPEPRRPPGPELKPPLAVAARPDAGPLKDGRDLPHLLPDPARPSQGFHDATDDGETEARPAHARGAGGRALHELAEEGGRRGPAKARARVDHLEAEDKAALPVLAGSGDGKGCRRRRRPLTPLLRLPRPLA